MGSISSMAANKKLGSRQFLQAAAMVLAAAVFITLAFSQPALARHRSAILPASAEEEGKPQPGLTAPYVSAVVMEPTTGTVLFEKDMHKAWPTASLAKMMLMLIVAEKIQNGSLKLSDTVTTSRKAAQMGGSQVFLKEDERFALDDMMKAVVVHSANDASVAVAEYVAGSTDAFVTMMNQEATKLGLKDTRYYSVHGLPADAGQETDVSSAYDLALIARELVKYPDVLRWSAIDTAPFRNGSFQLRNTNHLVRTYQGCDGLKTGFYQKAGFNVVATAHRNGLRLIAVVLGSPRKNGNFNQASTMLSQGFLNYEMRQIIKRGTSIEQTVLVKGGTVSSLKPVWGADASLLVKRENAKAAYRIDYKLPSSITAPIKAGKRIGTGEITVDGKVRQDVPLIAPADLGRGTVWQRLSGMI
jgi:serine-type D-Ala-D-Ala carboxypeptidase (penicillin-binding protein 5/6)